VKERQNGKKKKKKKERKSKRKLIERNSSLKCTTLQPYLNNQFKEQAKRKK
jgi:hypothetical protein